MYRGRQKQTQFQNLWQQQRPDFDRFFVFLKLPATGVFVHSFGPMLE